MVAAVNLLAIESATDLVGAALVTADGRLFERSHPGGRQHAELLAPSIDAVCREAALAVGDLDAVAVDLGPGLFTGLRVGVATAKALAQGLGVGLVGVTSLDVLAAGAAAIGFAGRGGGLTVVAVVDARRGEVFVARYRFGSEGGTVGGGTAGGVGTAAASGAAPGDPARARLAGPELVAPEVLVALLAADQGGGPAVGERTVVVGGGAVRYRELLQAVPGADLSLADQVQAPSPAVLARLAVVRLAAGEPPVAPVDLVPDYRRDADAKINWEQRGPVDQAIPAVPPTRR